MRSVVRVVRIELVQSLDTRRDAFFLCISFCFLKALHLHLHSTTSTYGQAWPKSSQTSDMNRISNSARNNRRTCLISITCWVNKSQQMSAEQESQYIQYHYGMLTLTLGEAQRLLNDCRTVMSPIFVPNPALNSAWQMIEVIEKQWRMKARSVTAFRSWGVPARCLPAWCVIISKSLPENQPVLAGQGHGTGKFIRL